MNEKDREVQERLAAMRNRILTIGELYNNALSSLFETFRQRGDAEGMKIVLDAIKKGEKDGS